MWKLNVPKILHVYWGGEKLSYLRFMTVKSFMAYNPDWNVMLWYPKYPYKTVTWNTSELNYKKEWDDYFPELLKLDIKKQAVDFTDYGIKNEISEVHKSDFLRYYFLNKYGGVYSDMDILYFRSITNLAVNRKINKDIKTFVCLSHYGHSNGFFMAQEGSQFFGRMFELAHDVELVKYQSNGPDLCNKHFPTLESINKISSTVNIGMEAVYYYNGQNVWNIYNDKVLNFSARSIGIHWYAGHPLSGMFLNNTKGGIDNYPDNILGNICKIVL
jgi:hypothetical protein